MSKEEMEFFNDPPGHLLVGRDAPYCWCTKCGTGPYLINWATGEPVDCYKCGG